MKTLLCLIAVYTTTKALNRIQSTQGDNVTLQCSFKATNRNVKWSKGSKILSDGMQINPMFAGTGKYRLDVNSSIGEYNLQVINLDLQDEGNYTCETNIFGRAHEEFVYLSILTTVTKVFNNEISTKQVDVFIRPTVTKVFNNEISTKQVDVFIRHISIRDFVIVVVLVVCVSFFTSFCCVMKVRQQNFQRSHNMGSSLVTTTRRSQNGITIELNEDSHLYNEINELEAVNPSREDIFNHILEHELENNDNQNDENDYLHPYHSLLPRSHLDDNKYEDLINSISNNSICDPVNANTNKCTHSQLIDTIKFNRFGDRTKIMFYSEPCNLHKCFFQQSLCTIDIKRQGNKSLDKVFYCIWVKPKIDKHIDDNISLD